TPSPYTTLFRSIPGENLTGRNRNQRRLRYTRVRHSSRIEHPGNRVVRYRSVNRQRPRWFRRAAHENTVRLPCDVVRGNRLPRNFVVHDSLADLGRPIRLRRSSEPRCRLNGTKDQPVRLGLGGEVEHELIERKSTIPISHVERHRERCGPRRRNAGNHERLPNVVSLIPPKHWALRWADGLILRVEPLNIEPHPRRVLLLAPPSRAQRITSRGDKLTGLNWNSSAVRDRVGDGIRVRGNTDLHRVGAREDRRSRVDGERPKPCRAPSRIPVLEIRISKTGL